MDIKKYAIKLMIAFIFYINPELELICLKPHEQLPFE